jgi:hypothetical protein
VAPLPATTPRGRSIERQVALKAAAEYGSAAGLDIDAVVRTAEKFDAFLASGRPGADSSAPVPPTGAAQGADSGGAAPAQAGSDEDIPF